MFYIIVKKSADILNLRKALQIYDILLILTYTTS